MELSKKKLPERNPLGDANALLFFVCFFFGNFYLSTVIEERNLWQDMLQKRRKKPSK